MSENEGNRYVDLYLSTAADGPDQMVSDELVRLVCNGYALRTACRMLGVNQATWYRRKKEGGDMYGRTEMQWFALRLAAVEVGLAKARLRELAETLEVDTSAYPVLLELQEPLAA